MNQRERRWIELIARKACQLPLCREACNFYLREGLISLGRHLLCEHPVITQLENEGRSVCCESFRNVVLMPSNVKCSLEFEVIDRMNIYIVLKIHFYFMFNVLPAMYHLYEGVRSP